MRGVEAPGCTVHIVAPFGRDAESIAVILDRQDLSVCIHDSLAQMARQLDDSAGVVVLTEEAVSGDVEALTAALQAQPPWSDIPFVLLRSSRGAYYNRHTTLPAAAINVIELERRWVRCRCRAPFPQRCARVRSNSSFATRWRSWPKARRRWR